MEWYWHHRRSGSRRRKHSVKKRVWRVRQKKHDARLDDKRQAGTCTRDFRYIFTALAGSDLRAAKIFQGRLSVFSIRESDGRESDLHGSAAF